MAKEAQTGPRWTAGARVPGARRCCACWGGGALACAREISRVLWHRHSCLYSTTTLPWKLLTPPVYPTAENRGNNKAADRKVRGLIAMLLGWYRNTYSLAGVTFFLTLVPAAICCPGHRYGTFALPPGRKDGSSRVRGRALLSFRLVPEVRQRSLLSLQIETCAPFKFLPGPLSLVSHSCLLVDREL